MLTREIFVDAIDKIKKHEELMERLDATCREFGDFYPSLDFSNLHLQALLEVLKEAIVFSKNHRIIIAYQRQRRNSA